MSTQIVFVTDKLRYLILGSAHPRLMKFETAAKALERRGIASDQVLKLLLNAEKKTYAQIHMPNAAKMHYDGKYFYSELKQYKPSSFLNLLLKAGLKLKEATGVINVLVDEFEQKR